MYLRSHQRNKDGKQHRYFTVVETRRLSSGKTAQRRVLYLSEINGSARSLAPNARSLRRIGATVPLDEPVS
jgi:hypothetical protein